MSVLTKSALKPKLAGRHQITIIQQYDTAADSKSRVSLRGARTKYFHVKELSNADFLLESRVLVPRAAVSARTLKVLDQSVANLKRGKVSALIDCKDSGVLPLLFMRFTKPL